MNISQGERDWDWVRDWVRDYSTRPRARPVTILFQCPCLEHVEDPDEWGYVTEEWIADKSSYRGRLPDGPRVKHCPNYRIYHIKLNDDGCCIVEGELNRVHCISPSCSIHL